MTRARGFTLIELLVTVAILAIGLAIGVPSLLTFQRNAELTSATNALSGAINVARGEAMKRNRHAFVKPLGSKGWASGYRVFIDLDNDKAFSARTDLLVTEQDPDKGANLANLEITGTDTAAGTAGFLRFDGSGYLRGGSNGFTNAAITLRRLDSKGTSDEFNQTRNVLVARTGRVRVCKPVSATDANCNAAAP